MVLRLHVDDLAESLLNEICCWKCEIQQPHFLPESRVTLGKFDPLVAPASGAENSSNFIVALDVDKMLLNTGLAFGHICLKGLHYSGKNIKVQEVPEADRPLEDG